tara:strand:+ start:27826 stop:28185 length:360 start_codon:yes stop_codon:yes gene_type:complete
MNKFQSLIAMAFASLLAIACGSSDPKVAAPAPIVEVDAAPQVVSGIVFDVTPGDAEVIVDGEPLGIASEIGDAGTLELDPGLHQIMIRHEDYEIYRVEVTIGDTIEPMQISLKEKTPES